MARQFKGNVSIYKNTKNRIVLKADDDGEFNSENASELLAKMQELAKKHSLELKVFKPKAGGNQAVLLSDKWGKPYIAQLPEQEIAGPVRRIEKLG